jgi:hypothetical protein
MRLSPVRTLAFAFLLCGVTSAASDAALPLQTFDDPALNVPDLAVALESDEDVRRAARLGSSAVAYLDPRTGRFSTLAPGTPLLYTTSSGDSARHALDVWLRDHASTLRIAVEELGEPRVNVVAPGLIQILVPRVIDGVPVRDATLTATIAQGRLALLGLRAWADAPPRTRSHINAEAVVQALTARYGAAATVAAPKLEWIPAITEKALDYRLVWSHELALGADLPHEVLVDAKDGQVIALRALDQHLGTPRTVGGGVHPLSNDGATPDGVEQTDWPMPFIDVTTPAGVVTTDAGGRVPACVDGVASAMLSGPYATVADACGTTGLTSIGDLDFGVSGGSDCATPASGGGRQHARGAHSILRGESLERDGTRAAAAAGLVEHANDHRVQYCGHLQCALSIAEPDPAVSLGRRLRQHGRDREHCRSRMGAWAR